MRVPLTFVIAGSVALSVSCGSELTAPQGGSSGAGGTPLPDPGSEPFPTFGSAEQLLGGLTMPFRVEVRDGLVYWTEGPGNTESRVARIPAQGGSIETLFEGARVTALHLDESALFFAEQDAGVVRRMTYDGAEPTPFATAPASLADMDRVGDALFYTYFGAVTGLGYRPLAQQTPETNGIQESSGSSYFTYVKSVGTRMFVTIARASSTSTTYGVASVNPDGTGMQIVSRPQVAHLAADAKYLYFASREEGRVFRYEYARSAAVEEAIAELQPGPFAVAADGAGVYFTNTAGCFESANQDGSVVAVRHDGTVQALIATSQYCPQAIAVDANAVYWLNRGSESEVGTGSLMRAPKLK